MWPENSHPSNTCVNNTRTWSYIHSPCMAFIFFYGSTAIVGLCPLTVEVSQSHSVGFLWTSDRPLAQTSTQYSQETGFYATGGIRTHDPSKQTAADPNLRPRGHWDKIINIYRHLICQLHIRENMCDCLVVTTGNTQTRLW